MKIVSALAVSIVLLVGEACKQPNVDVDQQPSVSLFVTLPKAVRGASHIVFDNSDNMYLSDYYGNRIWKITPQGIFSVFAGSGEAGLGDGLGQKAQFNLPQGLAFDQGGNLYVSQVYAIRKITPDGLVSTVYGAGVGDIAATKPTVYDTTRLPVYQGSILFQDAHALKFDKVGNLFIAEGTNDARLLQITPDGQITVVKGQPFNDQVNSSTKTNHFYPDDLVFDSQGTLFVTDPGEGTLARFTSRNGNAISYLTTKNYGDAPPGSGPFLKPNDLSGMAIDKDNNLYVCEDQYLEKVTTVGVVSKLAGSGKSNYVINGQLEPPDTGAGRQVRLFGLRSPVFDSKGNLYVLEQAGIRRITL